MRFVVALFLLSQLLFASTLYKTLSSNPSRLNPLLATDSSSGAISSYLFDGLVKYDKNAKVIGALAESFEFKDKKRLIFRLRKNIRWHDGHPFTSKDVLFTYNLLTNKDKKIMISTPYSTDFRMVQQVEALDAYTVEVVYKTPYYKAAEIWMMGILPYHLLKDETNFMNSDFNRKPVGTGPYMLESLELSKNIVLKANEHYYEHRPHIDRIIYSIVPDGTTRFYMMQKKEVDLDALEPLQIEKKVDKSFKNYYNIVEQIAKAYTYLGFNMKRELFQDKRIREAISLGIDKKELVDLLFFRHGQACHGPFLPGSFAYNDSYSKSAFNPEKAKKLLKEAGYTKEHPLRFEIATNTGNSIRQAAAQVIQYQLGKIGVEVKLRMMEWQAFLNTKVFAKDFDAVILGWGLSLIPDAYAIWHSDGIDKKGGFNFISYKNEAVDRMILQAERTVDKAKLAKIYQSIFAKIVEDHPYVFLYIPNEIAVVNKKIHPVEKSIVGLEHNIIDWIKD